MAAASNVPCSRLRMFIQCRNLLDKDVTSKSDPCCVVSMKDRRNPNWREIGRTEVIKNKLNPDFQKTFEIPFVFEERQDLRFEVYDIDNATSTLSDDDFLGSAECTVGEIVGSAGQRLLKDLVAKNGVVGHNGKIAVSVEEISDAANSSLTITLSGRKLAKKDTFGKSDPYIIITRKKPDGTDVNVCRSETIKNDLNPNWNPFKTDTLQFCNNAFNAPLHIVCWDYDRGSADDQIGHLTTTLEELIAASKSNKELKLLHPKGKPKDVGSIIVRNCDVVKVPTFMDYIRGGCEINLLVAIDFTASNKDPSDPHSLHFRNPQSYNEYQQAIISVGEILQHYDSDKLFPVYGFGAKLPDGHTSHCFALNGNPANPYCAGVAGILQAYNQALGNVQLYGPTNFAEIIRLSGATATQALTQQTQKYFILLIITDGEITDLHQTVTEIIKASSLPLSIIIVGVGSAQFTAMKMLDGDEVALQNGGSRAERDIVQFVEFRAFAQNGPALAAEVLYEVPGQMVGFFRSKGMHPNPPIVAPQLA